LDAIIKWVILAIAIIGAAARYNELMRYDLAIFDL
jgi:hypothetical protein